MALLHLQVLTDIANKLRHVFIEIEVTINSDTQKLHWKTDFNTFAIKIKQKITFVLSQPHGATFTNIETLLLKLPLGLNFFADWCKVTPLSKTINPDILIFLWFTICQSVCKVYIFSQTSTLCHKDLMNLNIKIFIYVCSIYKLILWNLALLAITKWLIENNYYVCYLCLFCLHINSSNTIKVLVRTNDLM